MRSRRCLSFCAMCAALLLVGTHFAFAGAYGGTPAAVPGTVQAENYDTGGQGIAYNVTSINGTANNYRSDGVDLQATTDTGGGLNLGWTATGQWFTYTVNVATAGTYRVTFRVAAINAVTDAFHISNSSGTNLTGNVNLPATGGWQTWTSVVAAITLPAGQQTLTFNQDNPGWNLNYFTVSTSSGPFGGTPAAVPGTVQAENYDLGGPGAGFNVTSINGTANNYRSDGVDLEATTDTGGGLNLGWTATGQWFRYTVNAASAGTYTVSFRVAAMNAVTDGFHISSASGTNLTGNVSVPGTGGWQNWTSVTASLTLPAGQQVLTVNQDNAGWNMNYMTFTSGGGGTGSCAGVPNIVVNGTTYVPRWCQEFNGGAGPPDPAIWNFDLGNNNGWGNNEVEVYCGPPGYPNNPGQCPTTFSTSTAPVYIDGNGHLLIQPRKVGGTWISGRMTTQGKQTFQFGILEASIQLMNTNNQGLWPSIWALGNNIGTVGWPNCGESDIMENWSPQVNNGAGTTGENSTVHTTKTGGIGVGRRFTFPSGEATDTAFHIYGQLWAQNQIQYFVDDPSNPFFTVTPNSLPAGDNWAFNQPIFTLLNVALGGTLGGSTANLTNPGPMQVDYVRYYTPQ
jgi:beta-glucanase (GH16 family)